MTAAFGHLPRTRILEGSPGSWSGDNNVFTGIRLYRTPDMAGVWAQEFWEWRLHATWTLAATASAIGGMVAIYALQSWLPMLIGLLCFGLATCIDLRNPAAREIYSHAITLEAAIMVGELCSEDEMVGSLATYSYCKGISRAALLERLRSDRPKARAWCQTHRRKIERVAALQRADGG